MLQLLVVGIRIGAVAATIDIATNTGIDAHGIAAFHIARDVIAAIDIVDIATTHQHTG